MSTRLVKLAVDREYTSEVWWVEARKKLDWFPDVTRILVEGSTPSLEILVTWDEFHKFLRVAQALPGWNEGPRFAPCPITMTEVFV